MKAIRIGTGAGFSGDRIEPAVELAEKGELDYLVFECLAERTIALAQQAKMKDPAQGYDPLLVERMQAVLPACRAKGIRIITNMGAANPLAAAEKVKEVARSLGLGGIKIAAVTGDDVLEVVRSGDYLLEETGEPVGTLGNQLVSANAYLGARPIVEALAGGADIVVTGRAADPAMFLAPQIHEFGWSMEDWTRLGRGTVVGHLLECAGQITGGYFADPGFKDVPDLARLGFPLAEVSADGTAVITKVPGSGGMVTAATCKEQLLYEVHDPARYFQPDVVADFSGVTVTEVGPDRVRVEGGDGSGPDRQPEGVGRLHRQLCRRGPDLLRRPGCLGARPAGARDRGRAAEADRRAVPGDPLRPHRRRRDPWAQAVREPGTSRRRCGSGSSAGPTAWRTRCASATRWRRSTSTARPAAAGRRSRPRRWSPSARCSSRSAWPSLSSLTWRAEMRLRAIAHSRTGDKGDTSNIAVIAYDAKDYPLLERHVTAERVKEHFAEIVRGEVVRYALPGLGALNFVLRGALGGGVTRSLALDAHGKCLGSAILDLELPAGDA